MSIAPEPLPLSREPDGVIRVGHTRVTLDTVVTAYREGAAVRVLVLIPETDADEGWEALTAEEFGRGYAEGDAIYDQLSGR